MPVKQEASSLPPAERINKTYKSLAKAAVELNAVSDELGQYITIWNSGLQNLNLGLSAWVKISSGSQEPIYWWDRSVGYTKAGDRWTIALRSRTGSENEPEESPSEEIWPFNDAPRWMRIEAIAKLPDLLEALLKQTEDTARSIKKNVSQIAALSEALKSVIAEVADSEEAK